MAGGYQHQPQGASAVAAELRALRAETAELRRMITGIGIKVDGSTGNTVYDGTGGNIKLAAGGTLEVDDTDGNVVASFGDDPVQVGRRGFVVRRPDGTLMFAAYPIGGLGLQYTSIIDQGGNQIVMQHPFGGLGRPYLSLGQWVDYPGSTGTFATPATSSTFVTAQTCFAFRQHRNFYLAAIVNSSAAAATGDVQLIDFAGNPVGGTVAITPNATSFVTLGPTTWPSWSFLDSGYLSLQIRRTGASGTVAVRGTGIWGYGNA